MKTFIKKDYDYFNKIIHRINLNTEDASLEENINIPEIAFTDGFMEIELPPGAYELVDINNTIKQIISDSDFWLYDGYKFNIEADTISMKSIFKSYGILLTSELNKLLGFTNEYYSPGTHKSEKPVMITTTDKVHLKCDCVDGSIVNGIREQVLYSFNLSAPP